MSKKVLENVKMGPTWTSYAAAAFGIVKSLGWYEGDMARFLGDCGMGFHFIVANDGCPSSVTVYDWYEEHILAMDRIGIRTEIVNRDSGAGQNTYAAAQKDAVEKVKASLDAGMPVLAWAPTPILEFGIINGYDDADGVFFVEECTGRKVDPLLYANLGKSEVPMLFCQFFREKLALDPIKAVKEALRFALREWNKEQHVGPGYASGRKGYANLLAALKSPKRNDFGLAYVFAVYADSKGYMTRYLEYAKLLSPSFVPLAQAVEPYRKAAECWEKMAKIHPFKGQNGMGGGKLEEKDITELALLAQEALVAEEKAFEAIAKAAI
jgi:hypothetical protein